MDTADKRLKAKRMVLKKAKKAGTLYKYDIVAHQEMEMEQQRATNDADVNDSTSDDDSINNVGDGNTGEGDQLLKFNDL